MDFSLSDEQELLLESLEEFIDSCGFDEAYLKRCWDENRLPSEYYDSLTAAGFGTLGLPEAFGGTPIDTLTMMLVNEKTNALGFPNRLSAMLEIDDMLTFANEEQQKIVFDILGQGRKAFCLGFSEPQAGSDSLAVSSTAVRKDGKVYINGHKTFITGAQEVEYMLTITRDFDSGKPAHKSLSMWMVPLNASGVTIEPMHKVGWRLQGSLCEVYLDNVEVGEKDLVGVEGNGFIQLMKNFEVERLLMASTALGVAVCAYNDALVYATQREQFGQPLKEFQMIQDKIVNMAIKIENMKNFVYKCAWKKDSGKSIQNEANLCKIYCSRAAFEVCDEAVQIFAGIGYTEEHRVSRLWRDVRLNRIGGGTDEILIRAAAKQLFKNVK
jgi:alkylation response protein AidB-like acyl-CoA dehydrogenase